jgi:hypothetical protein
MAGSVWFIEGMSDEAARRGGGKEREKEQARAGFLDLMRDKRVLAFAAAVILFNISNFATCRWLGRS